MTIMSVASMRSASGASRSVPIAAIRPSSMRTSPPGTSPISGSIDTTVPPLITRRCLVTLTLPLSNDRCARNVSPRRAVCQRALRGSELRRLPRRGEPRAERGGEVVDRHALLLERVAIAHGDRAVLERLVVDRHAERRADLVLAAVALADRAALVVLGLHLAAQQVEGLLGELGLAILAHE